MISKIQAKSQCPSQAKGASSWSWHQLDSGERSFGVIRYLWQAIVWTKRPSRLQVGLGESPWYVGTASGRAWRTFPAAKSKQGTHVVSVLVVQVSTHFKASSYYNHPSTDDQLFPRIECALSLSIASSGLQRHIVEEIREICGDTGIVEKMSSAALSNPPQPTKLWALPHPRP